jgi:hypothetical protein
VKPTLFYVRVGFLFLKAKIAKVQLKVNTVSEGKCTWWARGCLNKSVAPEIKRLCNGEIPRYKTQYAMPIPAMIRHQTPRN